MDPNKISATIFLAVVVYTWGCLNRGWTSPLDIWVGTVRRRGGHPRPGHGTRRPDAPQPPDAQPAPAVSTPAPAGPLRPAQVLHAAPTRPSPGPLPAHATARGTQEHRPHETRMAWARRQVDAGLLEPGEIDQIGAEMFGVDPRTVRRWRKLAGDERTDDKTATT